MTKFGFVISAMKSCSNIEQMSNCILWACKILPEGDRAKLVHIALRDMPDFDRAVNIAKDKFLARMR